MFMAHFFQHWIEVCGLMVIRNYHLVRIMKNIARGLLSILIVLNLMWFMIIQALFGLRRLLTLKIMLQFYLHFIMVRLMIGIEKSMIGVERMLKEDRCSLIL